MLRSLIIWECRRTAVDPLPDALGRRSGKDTVRLWPLRISDLLTAARTVAGRNLSLDEWELFFQGQPYRRTFPDPPALQPAK